MDHDTFLPNNSSFGTFLDTPMDLDVMDRVMFQGYWCETEPASFSGVLYDPHEMYRDEKGTSPENPLVYPGFIEQVVGIESTATLLQSNSSPPENGDLGIGWWVESSCSVKERLMLAVEYLKAYVEAQEVLIQIWVPTEIDGRSFLTTVDQPFTLNPKSESLASYRNVSINFQLAAEEDSTDSAGLPGRVFLGKFPEWTPDVRYFRSDECPRKSYAKLYNISGCLALPVFDVNGTCLAVVEIVTTTQKISYHLELESVYRALEAVELRGSLDFYPPAVMKPYNEVYQVAVPEILDILQSVCKTHRLPLALTWAPCASQDKSGYHQFSEKYAACISTVDSAWFIAEEDFLGFQVACSEQYLFPDQGIVGKAFTTNKQCFATDVTSICKTNYPLSHHARMFRLRAAVAIPLRSIHTGSVEYVLELFLPKDCHDIEEQKQVWNSLSNSIQQVCRSLQVVSNKELDEAVELKMEVIGYQNGTETFTSSCPQETSPEESTFIPHGLTAREDGPNHVYVSWECPKQEPEEEFKVMTHWDNSDFSLYPACVLDFGQLEKTSGSKRRFDGGGDSYMGWSRSLGIRKASKKRQTKSEKTVSLQVLRQYFAGSLKDAAKSIGVCPTTLKRICRQHGITRWPSRKIKKVSHSLRKLQLVVDSVEGAEGLIQIDSFYTIFPELNSPRASGNSPFSSNTMSEKPKELKSQPETDLLIPEGTDSKSQSSSSGQNSGVSGDDIALKDPGAVLNRTYGGAELHSRNLVNEPKLLARSQHQTQEALQHLPISCDQSLRNGGAFRVKATFAEENIRFSLQPNWSFRDMQQEIAKRFNIDDFSRIDLKYLDNDCESVLLTCDDDLEECKDIFSSSPNQTIKMTLCLVSQPNLGSSFGSKTLC